MMEPQPAKVARTYRLNPATVRRLDAVCAGLDCNPSVVADALLRWALSEVEAGALLPSMRPSHYTLAAWRPAGGSVADLVRDDMSGENGDDSPR